MWVREAGEKERTTTAVGDCLFDPVLATKGVLHVLRCGEGGGAGGVVIDGGEPVGATVREVEGVGSWPVGKGWKAKDCGERLGVDE